MTFAQFNLNPEISKAILACGYDKPTPIQARSIPDILNGKDLVATAQTGTGKTAAFVLPALHHLSLSRGNNKPRVLILTPTRELASQITTAVNKYGKFLRVNTVSLVGGMPYSQQLKGLSRGVDIVVATPGRLLDHLQSGRLDLSGIEMLILDEADRMLDMGFVDDVTEIASATPSNRQTLLFSATVDHNLTQIIRKLLKNPVNIELSSQAVTPTQITQEMYMTDHVQHKLQLLQNFLDNGNIFKAIVFSATKVNADQLAKQLSKQGYSAAALHGDLRQNVRNRTIDQLRTGRIQFLIATDVAARGINISDVTHVINFDLPRFAEDYVHRIGRTGRAGKTGIAISFALPTEGRLVQKIERYIGQRVPVTTVPGMEPTRRQSNAPASSGGGYAKKGRGGKPSFGGGRFDSSRSSGGDRFERSGSRNSEGFGAPKSRGGDRFERPMRSGENKFGAPKSRSSDRFERPASRSGEGFGAPKSRGGDRFERPMRSSENKFGAPKSRSSDRFERPASRSSEGFGAPKSRGGDRFERPMRSSENKFGAPKSRSGEGFGAPKSRGGDRFERPMSRSSDNKFGAPKSRGGDRFERPTTRSGEGFGAPKSRGGDRFERPASRSTDSFGGGTITRSKSRSEDSKPTGRRARTKKVDA